jgi:hemoglobin-like flavoprotein
MEPTTKRKRGNPDGKKPMGDIAQGETFQFRCTPGSREVWKMYADGLKLDQTELFYRMIHHLASHGDFITWFQKNQPHEVEANPDWFESWKMVAKCCENIIMMNKGRVNQVQDKHIERKVVKEVADVLHKHFTKATIKLNNKPSTSQE